MTILSCSAGGCRMVEDGGWRMEDGAADAGLRTVDCEIAGSACADRANSTSLRLVSSPSSVKSSVKLLGMYLVALNLNLALNLGLPPLLQLCTPRFFRGTGLERLRLRLRGKLT